jgi:dephospho-CoA kinase
MVTIEEPDPWAEEFAELASELRALAGADAIRIDHIGSTSVPGLAAKDIIDIQITVGDEAALARVAAALEEHGVAREPHIRGDHVAPVPRRTPRSG